LRTKVGTFLLNCVFLVSVLLNTVQLRVSKALFSLLFAMNDLTVLVLTGVLLFVSKTSYIRYLQLEDEEAEVGVAVSALIETLYPLEDEEYELHELRWWIALEYLSVLLIAVQLRGCKSLFSLLFA